MTTAVFDNLIELEKQQALNTQATYQQMVISCTDGNDVDLNEMLRVSEANGKTIEQLKADVALLHQRRQWAQQIDDAAIAAEKHETARDKLRELLAERAELVADIDQQIAGQRKIIKSTESQMYDNAPRKRLAETALEELRAREKELNSELQPAGARVHKLQEQLRISTASASNVQRELSEVRARDARYPDTRPNTRVADEYERMLESRQKDVDMYTGQLEDAETRIAAIQTELAEIREQKLIP